MASKGQTRATALPLLVIFGVTALLYGLIAINGWGFEPKRGLDLQGGTSVRLAPRAVQSGAQVSSASINKARDIIERRVNAFGVAESEVFREGNNIVVSIPGGDREQIANASKTAQLRFRIVQDLKPGVPTPATPPAAEASPGASASATPSAATSPSASASATPSAEASPTATPSATSSATSRALTAGLVRQGVTESATATESATETATATPDASATGDATASVDPNASPDPNASLEPDAETPVEEAAPQAPAPSGPGAAEALAMFTQLDCLSDDPKAKALRDQAAASDADAGKFIATCNEEGTQKYLLGPAQTDEPGTVVGMTGTDVRGAEATIPENEWIVTLQLTGEGRKKFTTLTTNNVGRQFAIVLDGLVVSDPVINEAIPGDATISGSFNKKSANDLAGVLKFGALPLSFERLALETISPSLGKESLRAGVLAGLVGLAAVLLYIMAYYRGLGLVTVVGLSLWAALNYALIVILGETIGFTLTLAGIAGLIISAGITSDSYIVYFERLKDEAREGRSIQSSADRGFSRAFRTIVAANTVSLLAAVILYRFSAGAVRGFAFTLGLSTVLDLFIAYMFTRPVVAALARTKLFSSGRFVGIKGSVPIAERAGRVRTTKEA